MKRRNRRCRCSFGINYGARPLSHSLPDGTESRTPKESAPCHICTGPDPTSATSARCSAPGMGWPPATAAPGLRSPPPHLHRDWAQRCHVCTGTGFAAATSALGLGSPLPHLQCAYRCHLHRDWAPPGRICTATPSCSASHSKARTPSCSCASAVARTDVHAQHARTRRAACRPPHTLTRTRTHAPSPLAIYCQASSCRSCTMKP